MLTGRTYKPFPAGDYWKKKVRGKGASQRGRREGREEEVPAEPLSSRGGTRCCIPNFIQKTTWGEKRKHYRREGGVSAVEEEETTSTNLCLSNTEKKGLEKEEKKEENQGKRKATSIRRGGKLSTIFKRKTIGSSQFRHTE